MSLENIEKKLLSTGDIPFWKFVIYFGVLPAIIGLSIFYLVYPNIPAQLLTFESRVIGLASFTAFSLILFFFSILTAVGIIRILSKISYGVTYRHGIFTGHSLATNNDFLRQFAKNLKPFLFGIIRGYNDPKFETLENRIAEQDIRIEILEENDQSKNHIIADNNRTIFDLKYKVKELENKLAQKQNSVPVEEYERISQELLEMKEELRKLKGE